MASVALAVLLVCLSWLPSDIASLASELDLLRSFVVDFARASEVTSVNVIVAAGAADSGGRTSELVPWEGFHRVAGNVEAFFCNVLSHIMEGPVKPIGIH